MSHPHTAVDSSSDVTLPASSSDQPRADTTAAVPFGERLNAVEQSRNPLLEAARVLLRALADMPDDLEVDETLLLRDLLEQEVRVFQKLCEEANIRRDHMIGARYCLCTALDEAATQTAWGREGSSGIEWISNGLATTFHEDRHGGDKVYLLIARLLQDPLEHHDLLEVIYRILSLGFEGRYRHEAHGKRKHDAIRQRLYNEITGRREPASMELSPHWRSDAKGRRLSVHDFPVWMTAAVLSAILLGLFGWFKYQLMSRSEELQKQIADIGRMSALAAPKQPQSKQHANPLRLKQLLKDEIAAGTVSLDEDALRSALTFRGDAMFPAGGASVKATMEPLIAKIASEIAKVPGKVTVLGYTDNVPIRSGQFSSNEALSKERAAQVMHKLKIAGVPAERLEAVGKGDADPVGDNRTAQGRAMNRRVAIVVAQ